MYLFIVCSPGKTEQQSDHTTRMIVVFSLRNQAGVFSWTQPTQEFFSLLTIETQKKSSFTSTWKQKDNLAIFFVTHPRSCVQASLTGYRNPGQHLKFIQFLAFERGKRRPLLSRKKKSDSPKSRITVLLATNFRPLSGLNGSAAEGLLEQSWMLQWPRYSNFGCKLRLSGIIWLIILQ